MTRQDLAIRMFQIFDQHPGSAIDGMLAALRIAEGELIPAAHTLMTKEDANDLDDVVRLLGIESDVCTPSEAVETLISEVEARRKECFAFEKRWSDAIDWMKQQCTYPCSPERVCVCDEFREGGK